MLIIVARNSKLGDIPIMNTTETHTSAWNQSLRGQSILLRPDFITLMVLHRTMRWRGVTTMGF